MLEIIDFCCWFAKSGVQHAVNAIDRNWSNSCNVGCLGGGCDEYP
jgi:hypothetical protein